MKKYYVMSVMYYSNSIVYGPFETEDDAAEAREKDFPNVILELTDNKPTNVLIINENEDGEWEQVVNL